MNHALADTTANATTANLVQAFISMKNDDFITRDILFQEYG